MWVITYEGKIWAGEKKWTTDIKEARGYSMKVSAECGRKRIIKFHPELTPDKMVVEDRALLKI
jgi:hypothetical protein